MTLTPSHLAGQATALDTDTGRHFGLRSSTGSDRFEIRYSGEILPEHGLMVGGESLSLFVARAVDTGKEVVVFHESRHGYNAMFVDDTTPRHSMPAAH